MGKNIFKRIEKGLRKPVKKVIRSAGPVLGAIAGNMIAPGLGAPIGAALVGASQRGHGNKGKGAVSGALQGAAYLGGSELGSYLNNQSHVPSHSSANPAYDKGESYIQGRPNDKGVYTTSPSGDEIYEPQLKTYTTDPRQLQSNDVENKFAWDKKYHGILSEYAVPLVETLRTKGLPIAKHIFDAYNKQKSQAGQAEQKELQEEEELGQGVSGAPGLQPPMAQEAELESAGPLASYGESPLDVFRRLFPKKSGENRLSEFMPQHKMRQYAHGGSVGHVKKAGSSGVADDITTKIPEGSYVWNTTDTSLLGDGSPENGVQKIKQFEHHFERSGIARSHEHNGKLMPVKLSNDEYVMDPKYVAAIGETFAKDPRKGPQVIDKARQNLRKQKGVQKILPPTAKDVKSYFRGGR